MIFICVGSREYQFNRLLKKLDELINNGYITEEVYAQIGQSSYLPKHFNYTRFMSVDDFKISLQNASLVISHGGTGSLVNALKLGKKVLAVPRLSIYGEHIDDHQIQVAEVLEKEGYLQCVLDIEGLLGAIHSFENGFEVKRYDKQSRVIKIIEHFIEYN